MADNNKQKLEYRRKLESFISEIPPEGKQIISGKAHKPPYAPDFKRRLEKPDPELFIEYVTDALFLKYTQKTQVALMQDWSKGSSTTTCNEFVGVCGRAMGANINLGQFRLEELLQKNKKAHAWISADSGKRPDYGDIFKPKAQHMGVSLGFEEDDWLTVESGQGGPNSTGDDRLKRKRQKFYPDHYEGWCDMRLFLDPRPPVPDWMIGMWTVYCGSQTYVYQFNQYYEAVYYPWKPIGDSQNAVPTDAGTISLQSADAFSVTWSKRDGTEKFKYDRFDSFPGVMEKMSGSSSRSEPLRGVRL